jgi:hypothetical protein
MSQLKTVPTFTFKQGDIFKMDSSVERPITVNYYNGSIELEQDGEYDAPEIIQIHPEYIKAFFKEVLKHIPEAEQWLKK